jgi:hypothetical protein
MFARSLLNLRFPSDQYQMNRHYILAMVVDPRYKILVLDETTKNLAVELLEREMIVMRRESVTGLAEPIQSTSEHQEG